jgi:hypothetical protein
MEFMRILHFTFVGLSLVFLGAACSSDSTSTLDAGETPHADAGSPDVQMSRCDWKNNRQLKVPCFECDPLPATVDGGCETPIVGPHGRDGTGDDGGVRYPVNCSVITVVPLDDSHRDAGGPIGGYCSDSPTLKWAFPL